MTAESRPPSRRVIVGAACFADAHPAIGVAIDLARYADAEIIGLLIEDEAVNRYAALPFAMALSTSTRRNRRVTPQDMTSAFARDAHAFEQTLAETTRNLSLRWSFERRKGRMLAQLRGVAISGDLLVLGHERPQRTDGEIVLVNPTRSVDRGLVDLALELSRTRHLPLRIFAPDGVADEISAIHNAHQRHHPTQDRVEIRHGPSDNVPGFLAYLGHQRPNLVLLAGAADLDLDIEKVVSAARCPVMTVADGGA